MRGSQHICVQLSRHVGAKARGRTLAPASARYSSNVAATACRTYIREETPPPVPTLTQTARATVDAADSYSAKHLSVLEGLDAVRKRPGMYIGSTDGRGLQHCLWEIFDNSVDEALGGFCTRIEVILHADGSAEVRDNGRGIPVDTERKTKLSGVELVLTRLHAGGKFGGGSYTASARPSSTRSPPGSTSRSTGTARPTPRASGAGWRASSPDPAPTPPSPGSA